ncbi:Ion channel-like protein 1 [Elsinoe fawcettii]|nr:Ion channel-like protein 1 [Elsinoe fawcettii]
MVHLLARRATSDSTTVRRTPTDGNTIKRRKLSPVKAALGAAKSKAVDKVSKMTVKPWTGTDDADWWFAGTAVPLLAATIGPLANVLSIAALVTSWRMCLIDGVDAATCPYPDNNPDILVDDLFGHTFADPRWCYYLNIGSLVLGVVGNIFLLFNFTGFVRYIIALPMTIIMWYLATGILIAITVSMEIHVPPTRPQQTYSQGFWYAVLAAIMYLIASMLLMLNMLGYFLGHFPQEFELTDSQRTLIVQTMLFFVWLAAGGGIFSTVETRYGDDSTSWSYVNALYFSDVTILTVGFGDLSSTSTVGRGLVFPYSVGGTIMLGLVISSISKFATELGMEKVVDKHREQKRARTVDRVITSPKELQPTANGRPPAYRTISRPFDPVNTSAQSRVVDPAPSKTNSNSSALTFMIPPPLRPKRKPRALLLRDERDRFNTMRRIQLKTRKYKQWTGLALSVFSFSLLWFLGAFVFYVAEAQTQQLTYFEALYFCYVSLLTIGYGDLAPKSNVGRPFFVLWSLIAVPTMTILISAMGDTVIQGFKKAVEKGAEVTILPRRGIVGDVLRRSGVLGWLEDRKARKQLEERKERGFEVGIDGEHDPEAADASEAKEEQPTKDSGDGNAKEVKPSDLELATRLAAAIQQVAADLKEAPPKRYEYDHWLEFTTLIKFTNYGSSTINDDGEEEEELIEWDWIGEDSPMMAKQSEPEFVLDRLCESMGRYLKHQGSLQIKKEKETGAGIVEAAGAIVEEDEERNDAHSDTDTAVAPS